MWSVRFIETLMQDLRYGVRMLVKNPGFTTIAVLTLALGIGANTVVFSIINAVLFHPRPVAEPERLVELYSSDARNPYGGSAYQDYLSFRDQGEVFSGLAAYRPGRYKLGGEDGVEPVIGEAVSGNYFDVLGVKAFRGRTFLPEEDRTPGSHPVVVIGHDLWRRRFGADPALIGKTIEINNQALTVIGVAPPEYTGMIRMLAAEVWVPVMMIPRLEPADDMSRLNNRGADWLFIVGRLKPEATLEQARARFDLISGQLREAYPEFWRKRAESGATLEKSVTILPESETRIPPGEGAGAYAFIAVVLTIINLVMLIACLNLANLLLARATARGKEMAVRLALGAARWRIVRQLLTESVALTALAATAGVLLAMWLMNGSATIRRNRVEIVNNFYARSVFFVKDAERSLRFYTETLGFSLEWNHQEQGRAYVFEVSLLGFQLILNQTEPGTEDRAGHGRLFIGLDDDQVDAFRKHIEEKGIKTTVLQWGAPTLVIRDLDENELFFGLPESERGSLQAQHAGA